MAKYKKSEFTMEVVIESCKKLFYEKGYKNTRFVDILKDSNVNTGLMYYHFKKKSNLAGHVYAQFLEKNKLFVQRMIGDTYDIQICTAVEIRILWHLINTDERFKRFIYEASLDRVIVEHFREMGEEFYRFHNIEYGLNISDEMLKIINISNLGSESEIIVSYIEGYLQLSGQEVSEFDIRNFFELMSLDRATIQQIINVSDEVFSKMNVKLRDYFELELK